MSRKRKRLLLINPWVYDFVAFDLWAQPLGLFYLAGVLKQHHIELDYVDFLNRHHPWLADKGLPQKHYGCGKYYEDIIPKPEALRFVPRHFRRFGLSPEVVRGELGQLPQPDAILVTSRMTYWYPGLRDTVQLCREIFPSPPLILGGTYATLCPDHVRRHIEPDYLIEGEGEAKSLSVLAELWGEQLATNSFTLQELDSLPLPALELMPSKHYAPVLTSRGCPRRCTYCAARLLFPQFRHRSPQKVLEEIRHWHTRDGTTDFAFYDDALLEEKGGYLMPLLELLIKSGLPLRFHTPNGLAPEEIDEATAHLMCRAGFTTLRLSLESSCQKRLKTLGRTGGIEKLEAAVTNLRKAGFSPTQIGVYLLYGLPGQTPEEAEADVEAVLELGVHPHLVEYSPIPGTALWEKAREGVDVDLTAEPLYQNSSVYQLLLPQFPKNFREQLQRKIQLRWQEIKEAGKGGGM